MKILIGSLILMASSAFAQTSEFERGFEEGRKSCGPQTSIYLCSAAAVDYTENKCKIIIGEVAVTGRTAAEALSKVKPSNLAARKECGAASVSCTKL